MKLKLGRIRSATPIQAHAPNISESDQSGDEVLRTPNLDENDNRSQSNLPIDDSAAAELAPILEPNTVSNIDPRGSGQSAKSNSDYLLGLWSGMWITVLGLLLWVYLTRRRR